MFEFEINFNKKINQNVSSFLTITNHFFILDFSNLVIKIFFNIIIKKKKDFKL